MESTLTMAAIKELVQQELGYLPDSDGFDRLLARAERIELPARHIVVEVGQTDPDVYVMAEGIIRFVDQDGDKERTFAFALPGTVFMSKHSFVRQLPSYYRVETCCPTTLLRIPHQHFWHMMEADHQLAVWMLHYAYTELFCQEHKFSNIHKGSAKERFLAMHTDRPEIIRKVPQRVIASYLGVTPEYLSTLRRQLPKP